MSPNTHPGPHYAEGRTLRIVLRKHALAANKRICKIYKRKRRERMERERMEVPT